MLLVGGCGPSSETLPEISVTWELEPEPPRVGVVAVSVLLADTMGGPVADAVVSLQGTMTHPGMRPVLAKATEVAPGRYEARLELSMRGDWILILDATLPDGRNVQRQMEFRAR